MGVLDPTIYQASEGISPTPSLQAIGSTGGIGVGAFEGSTYSTEPGSMYLSICVCIYTIVYVSLENPNLYRKVGRDINDCSYKKVA